MNERHWPASPADSQRVKGFLEQGLTGRPQTSVRDIIAGAQAGARASARPSSVRRWQRLAGLAAAAMAGLLILGSLQVPALARAVAGIPLLGEGYLRFVTGYGLDIAYQAGLVTDLDRSVDAGGITLRVTTALSDADQAVMVFVFESEDSQLVRRLWEVESSLDWAFSIESQPADLSFVRSGRSFFSQEEGRLYVMLLTEPIAGRWAAREAGLLRPGRLSGTQVLRDRVAVVAGLPGDLPDAHAAGLHLVYLDHFPTPEQSARHPHPLPG